MGNWNVSVEGVGPHHNGSALDVEQLSKEFLDKLRAAGHSVSKATVTTGGQNDLIVNPGQLLPVVKP